MSRDSTTLSDSDLSSSNLERLKTQLANAQSLQSTLENEVNELCRSLSATNTRTISTLPIELFVEILYPVVTESPMHILQLMLVSHSWRRIIQSTPNLWSTIHITVPLRLDYLANCITFCAQCIEGSAEYPLDITIEFGAVENMSWDSQCKVLDVEKQVSTNINLLTNRWKDDHKSGALYGDKTSLSLKPLHILSGVRSGFTVMKRWRSFKMISSRFIRPVLGTNSFGGDTPLLESLELSYNGISYGSTQSIFLKKARPSAFPEISKLRTLLLSDISMHLNLDKINPLTLERLNLITYNENQFRFAIRCHNVTSLCIGVHSELPNRAWHRMLELDTLEFPRLVHLTICDWVPSWFCKSLRAPLLDTLVFHTDYETRCIPALLSTGYVKRVELQWAYLHIDEWRHILRESLTPLLLSSSVTTIVCRNGDRWRVEQVLRGIRGTGCVPMPGKTLVFAPYRRATVPSATVAIGLTEEWIDSIVLEDTWCKFT